MYYVDSWYYVHFEPVYFCMSNSPVEIYEAEFSQDEKNLLRN